MPSYNTIFRKQEEELIKNFKFNEEQKKLLAKFKTQLEGKKCLSIIEPLYILYLNDYSTGDIGSVFGISDRMIQIILKELGLNRTREEAQAIAVKKRDYKEIRKTYKKTMLDRITTNQLFGSVLENVIRIELSTLLSDKLKDAEVIIGVNTMDIIEMEADIPIIIINDNVLFKYIVEVDGDAHHKDENALSRHTRKEYYASRKGYTIFRINTRGYYTTDKTPKLIYQKEVKSKLIEVVDEICKEVNNSQGKAKLSKSTI